MLTLCPQQQTFKGSHTLSLLAFGFSDLLRTRVESTLPVSEQHRMRLFSGDWLLTATPKNSCPSQTHVDQIASGVCLLFLGRNIYILPRFTKLLFLCCTALPSHTSSSKVSKRQDCLPVQSVEGTNVHGRE